ncbi:MAG: tetratricopeptide repeat protein [Bacteroidia bacterium]|nr:tetratricopeptide repeat protein [Bacteroidia bacterium]
MKALSTTAFLSVLLYAQASLPTPPKSIDTKVERDVRGGEGNRDFIRGYGLAQEGKYAQALQMLERSKSQDPHNPLVWYWIGYCQEHLGQNEAALQSYRTALQKNPHLVQAWWGKGSILFKDKQYEEAYQAFQQVIHYAPKEPIGYFYAGASLWMMERKLEAVPLWERAISLGLADSIGALVWIGDAYWESDSFSLAEGYYRRAASHPQAPAEALLGWGKARLAQNDPQAALPLLSQAESRLPEDPSPSYYKGMAYKRIGLMKDAQAAFQEALRRKPDHARSLYELGKIALADNKVDEAQMYYEKLKSINTRLAQQLLQEILSKR